MKIFFDAEDFKNEPRGIVRTTTRLYQACRETMPGLEIVGIARKPLAAPLPANIGLVTLRPDFSRSVWRFVMFNAYLAAHDCAAVHFPANGMIPKIYPRRNIVMTLHDVVQLMVPGQFRDPGKERRFRIRRQSDIDRASVIFTDSACSKRDIMKNFRVRSEPVVLPLAPTLAPGKYDPLYDVKTAGGYFLYTGGYDRRKGLDGLLKVFLELHRKNAITEKLYLTGGKYYYSETFRGLIDEANAMGIVKELGYVPDEELISLMRNARALIYPSFYEGFGLPPLEAMNVGCPVITTPFSSIPEVCGDAALYIRPEHEKEFADAIVALATNNALRKELIVKGKEQASKYSWDRSAAIFLEQIERISSLRSR